MDSTGIDAFHDRLAVPDRAICDRLRRAIDAGLPEAEARVWHAHPVWFLDGNPVAGYSRLKDCVRLMFWSGQGFEAPGLAASGSFKAAEARFTDAAQVDAAPLALWLAEARRVQCNYRDIRRNRGLVRLT